MRIALPKGRFRSLSEAAIVELGGEDVPERGLTSKLGEGATAHLLKARDIPAVVIEGLFDLGVATGDWCLERQVAMPGEELEFLRTGIWDVRFRISFVSAPNAPWPPPNGATVATRYPSLCVHALREVGAESCRVAELSGSVAAMVPEIAFYGFDCVETGRTLMQNSLVEVCVVHDELGVCVVSRGGSSRAWNEADLASVAETIARANKR